MANETRVLTIRVPTLLYEALKRDAARAIYRTTISSVALARLTHDTPQWKFEYEIRCLKDRLALWAHMYPQMAKAIEEGEKKREEEVEKTRKESPSLLALDLAKMDCKIKYEEKPPDGQDRDKIDEFIRNRERQ
jgi:hypothetical protein